MSEADGAARSPDGREADGDASDSRSATPPPSSPPLGSLSESPPEDGRRMHRAMFTEPGEVHGPASPGHDGSPPSSHVSHTSSGAGVADRVLEQAAKRAALEKLLQYEVFQRESVRTSVLMGLQHSISPRMLLKCADRVFRFLMLLFGDEHSEKHRLISKFCSFLRVIIMLPSGSRSALGDVGKIVDELEKDELLDGAAQQIKLLLLNRMVKRNKAIDFSPTEGSVRRALVEMKAQEFAEQLTLWESDLFAKVTLSDLYGGVWLSNPSEGRGHSVTIMTQHFNDVLTSVPDQRVNLLRWFLRVARSLWNIRNFNGAFEIVYGVTSQQLARLRSLVDKLPPKYLADLRKLQALVSPLNNYNKYREALSATAAPTVPALCIHLRDVITASDTIDESGEYVEHLADLIGLGTTLEPIWAYGSGQYDFKRDGDAVRLLSEEEGSPSQSSLEQEDDQEYSELTIDDYETDATYDVSTDDEDADDELEDERRKARAKKKYALSRFTKRKIQSANSVRKKASGMHTKRSVSSPSTTRASPRTQSPPLGDGEAVPPGSQSPTQKRKTRRTHTSMNTSDGHESANDSDADPDMKRTEYRKSTYLSNEERDACAGFLSLLPPPPPKSKKVAKSEMAFWKEWKKKYG